METSHIQRRRPKIALFSQPEYFRFTYENELHAFADVFEFQMQIGLPESAFDPLIEFGADYNFFYRGEFVPPGVLERLKGLRIALSSEPFPRVVDGSYSYTLDSVRRYLYFRHIRSMAFDYVFHYDAASLPFLQRDGLLLSGHFAFPVATSIYRPVDMPKEWDLFFIGRSTQHRESFFAHLKHHHHFLHICHGIWGEPLVGYLSRAKICLNVHAEDEVSWEPRMQMMLACGAFVISEKITPNAYLRPGIDYVEANTPQEMRAAVEHYLAHPGERERIACSGLERVRNVLSSREVFQTLIRDLDGDKYPRFRAASSAGFLDAASKMNHHWLKTKSRLRKVMSTRL